MDSDYACSGRKRECIGEDEADDEGCRGLHGCYGGDRHVALSDPHRKCGREYDEAGYEERSEYPHAYDDYEGGQERKQRSIPIDLDARRLGERRIERHRIYLVIEDEVGEERHGGDRRRDDAIASGNR